MRVISDPPHVGERQGKRRASPNIQLFVGVVKGLNFTLGGGIGDDSLNMKTKKRTWRIEICA